MNRVVITGMGIYSTIGKNIEEVRDALYQGKSGIVLDPYRKELQFRSGLTGAIERPVLKGVLPRRMRVGLPEQGEYAYLATMEALRQAKMDEDFLTGHEVGILYGNDSSAVPVVEATDIIREKQGTMRIGSGSIFQSMNSTVTMNLSVILKLKGINFTVSAACASGSHSIGMGYILIKQGMQDALICGGAQEINALSMGSFDALNAFSVREGAPQKASRPFDRDRDGLVPSGGAATIILENYETAIRRGAPIFGEVLGYGFSSNGEHISVPNVDGPKRSLEMALKDARIQAAEIDYLNAHATSTPVGDTNEAQAIFTVFNQGRVPVSSTKSMTGHEMWMGGTSEVIYSLIMAHNSFIAPNINFENPDEHSAKLNIISKTTEQKIDTFLSNSFGFGGTNSTLIIKKLTA
ncbi:MAG: beta-ketoacyl-[acyl-carrier-protein] synthase family protein [Bacteroidales bacterium]|nr:beta-ketoacyl-[acyl-carrier-protein] synthase family protein [Bacteroidales bacterium]